MLSQEHIERLKLLKARQERPIKNTRLPNRRNNWGLGIDGREKLKVEQENKCYLCGEYSQNLELDHNHETKLARKLLCGRCNTRLGLLESWIKETDLSLEELAIYIEL